jgi:hypothetical protein
MIGAMAIRRKNLDQPDEARTFDRGSSDLVHLGSHVIGRSIRQPGWRWSTDMRPLMGTPSCPIHHVEVLLSGRFAVRMDDGEEVEFGPNDVIDVPPGHDAWVVGDEPTVVLDFGGNVDGMGVPQEHQRVVTTLLMTDLVDSTRIAARIGDAAWKQLLADHDQLIRSLLDRFRGTEIVTTGDGFLASFAGAAGHCAVPSRFAMRFGNSASRRELGFTPARWSFSNLVSAASRSTPRLGSWRSARPPRSWCRR